MEQVFLEIAKQTPLVGVLAFFIWYFIKTNDRKDKRIEELSKFILSEQKEYSEQVREDQRQIIEAMNNVAKTLSELTNHLRYERNK